MTLIIYKMGENKMKILALYLPAFHRIKENDEWWGEGFTEWDNVKKAKKLYQSHEQPMHPLNNNYYDLSNKTDIEKQIKLAKEYRVDGFIFYHYWLDTNKMIFEKPAELLRDKIKEDIGYCFCWANHTWTATWDAKGNKVLMEQKYGEEDDWLKHIEYLYTFFKDDRYIKRDDRPVLYIYNGNQIEKYNEMLDCWNKYLKSKGMKEIYVIEYIFTRNKNITSEKTDAVVEFEPVYTTFFDISWANKLKRFICKKLKITDFQNYDKLWKYNIKRKRTYSGKKIYKSCFVGWDNSPRKAKNSMIVKGQTPEKFEKYLNELINNNREDASNEYVMINAWNEWGEGAMLEPTEEYKYKYLEAIKKVVENNEK